MLAESEQGLEGRAGPDLAAEVLAMAQGVAEELLSSGRQVLAEAELHPLIGYRGRRSGRASDPFVDALAADVEHLLAEVVGGAVADHVLVDGAVLVAAGAAPEVPGGIEPAVADGVAHEEDDAVDEEAVGGVGIVDGGEDLFAELRGDAEFVGVEDEDPFAGEREILEAPVLLAGVAEELLLDDGGRTASRAICWVPSVEQESRTKTGPRARAFWTVSRMTAASLSVGMKISTRPREVLRRPEGLWGPLGEGGEGGGRRGERGKSGRKRGGFFGPGAEWGSASMRTTRLLVRPVQEWAFSLILSSVQYS